MDNSILSACFQSDIVYYNGDSLYLCIRNAFSLAYTSIIRKLRSNRLEGFPVVSIDHEWIGCFEQKKK